MLIFIALKKKLAIEIDGESYCQSNEKEQKDKNRFQFIESQGIQILRFTNTEVMQNIEGCLNK